VKEIKIASGVGLFDVLGEHIAVAAPRFRFRRLPLGSAARQYAGPDPKRKYSEVTLVPRRYGWPERKAFRQLNDKGKLFLSAEEIDKTPDWRRLAVEVTPESVRLFWDDDKPFRVMTIAEVRELGEAWKPQGKVIFPEIDFDPEGALGLYVYRGQAAFRNVVVRPLD